MSDEQGGIVIGSVGGDLSLQAGGDIVAGNKTIINNVIQRIAKELTTTPYKFLASYEIADRDIFYGRDAVIEELAAQVGRHKVILINGASGAGKSSLVNAGLIPRVADNDYAFAAFREYSDPLAQLQAYFDTARGLAPPPKAADGQGSLLQLIRGFGAFPIVIFLDQFERFFVRVVDDKRREFITAFQHCLQHSEAKDMCFVLAFRREFLGQLTSEFEEQMPGFLNEAYRINLLPLSKTEAREAVVRPLEKTSLRIYYDEDFVDNVLLAGLAEQTGGGMSIDPPHLQIVCNQLFEVARQRLVPPISSVEINRALYDELGGAQNILNTYLDKVVENVAQDPERIAVVHSILKTMVDTGTNTRSFVSMEGFSRALPDVNEAEILRFIEKLLDRRVVEERKPAYSLSHEHMVGKVREWFDPRELERKRAEETLNRGMMEWKNSAALLNRGQVERIRKWLLDPAEEEQELLQTSEKNYLEEERKEASRKKLIKISQYGAAAFAVILMILGTFSFLKMREAVAARDAALTTQSRFLVDQARQAYDKGDIGTALALALEALPDDRRGRTRPYLPAAESMLYRAATTLRERHEWKRDGDYFDYAEFLADGQRIITLGRKGARIWDSATGTALATLEGFAEGVETVAFSRDGRQIITGSADGTARIWNAANGGPLREFKGHAAAVRSAALSPNGERIVTGSSDGTARIWDATNAAPPTVLAMPGESVDTTVFSPDGGRIVTTSSSPSQMYARIWDAGSGDLLKVIGEEHDLAKTDGRYAVIINDLSGGKTRIWDIAGGTKIGQPPTTDTRARVAFSPDGLRIAIGLKIWEAAAPSSLDWEVDGNPSSVVFSPDGLRIAAFVDKTTKIWNTTNRELVVSLDMPDRGISAAKFSPDGRRIVTLLYGGAARIWDTTDNVAFRVLHRADPSDRGGPRNVVSLAAVSPDGRSVVTASGDSTAKVWDIASGALLSTKHCPSRVWAIAFLPDGKHIVTASVDELQVWDASADAIPVVLGEPQGLVISVAVSPDGKRIVTGANSGSVQIWDASSNEPPIASVKLPGSVQHASFWPDGRQVIAVSGERAWLWNGIHSAAPAQLTKNAGVRSAAFSTNGGQIVLGHSDGMVRILNAETHAEVTAWQAYAEVTAYEAGQAYAEETAYEGAGKRRIETAVFSPDGKRVLIAAADDTARIYDAATGAEVTVLRGHEGDVLSAAFSSDGWIVTTSRDRSVRLWRAFQTTQALVDYAHAVMPRELTQEQRKEYFLNSGSASPPVPVPVQQR